MKRIKVVHLQKHLPASGNAAYRLHCELLNAGIDSRMLSLSSDVTGDQKICSLGKINQFISWVDSKILSYLTRSSIKSFGSFSYPVLGADISNRKEIADADVIYLHWINGGFLNLRSIKKLARLNKPLVFFMHDMWTITGGCHHSFQCEKYQTICSACQMFPRNKKNDLSNKEFKRKMKLYSGFKNFSFISPSNWLFNCSKLSKLTSEKPLYYIPNIIDDKLFKPFDKKVAKGILNIDPNARVISFGATSVDCPYKGWKYLMSALMLLKDRIGAENILILIFGSSFNKNMADSIPFKTRFIGRLRDDFSTVLVYNASDVFVAPSLAESFGYVILESLACGTPVAGFNVGGIPDLIKHKGNGYLARYKDADDLATGIQYCLENRISGSMLPVFRPEIVVEKHLDLINKLCSEE